MSILTDSKEYLKMVMEDNPQQDLKNKGVIDSGCSRHMIGNISYLTDYEEIDGGFVAFGDFKLIDESYVLLKVPRKDNMYNVDLNNVAPQGGLTYLFAKATPDESNLWHRRLGHDTLTSTNSKALQSIPNALINSMNYKPVVLGNQSNGNAGIKACAGAGKAKVETAPGKEYILLPLWTQDPSFSSSPKDSPNARFKPLGEEEKKDAKDPRNEGGNPSTEEPRINQEKDASVNCTNNINTVSPTINAASIENNVVDENIVYGCPDDPNIPDLEEIGRFSDAEDDGAEADMTNLDTHIPVSSIPTTIIHKDHPLNQFIGDLQSATQTRQVTKNLEKYEFVSTTLKQRTSHKDLQNCLFACFLSQEEPKKVVRALKDLSWIEAMQEELLQFKLQDVWTLVKLPNGKRVIGTKWVFRNKRNERGIVIIIKKKIVGIKVNTQEEEEVYVCQPPGFEDPDFPDRVYKVEKALYGLHQAPRAWYETLLTYLLDNGFQRGKIDKTLFIKRDKSDILLVQVSMGELTFFLGLQVKQKEDGIFISQDKYVTYILKKISFNDVKTASTPMETHKPLLKDADGEDVDEHLIFRYLKGQPKLGLWYPKDSPFDLVAYTDNDYAGASLDRKSTT
ncbi:putative ribonuclease H-like domain-containing protein [Tanacetum coccineum]